MPAATTAATLAEIIQCALVAAGAVVCWRAALSPAARARPARLAPWRIPATDFLACALIVTLSTFFLVLAVSELIRWLPAPLKKNEDAITIFNTCAMQLGALAGLLGARAYLRWQAKFSAESDPPASAAPVFDRAPPAPLPLPVAGLLTFFAVLPAAVLSDLIGSQIIRWCGLPAEKQEAIEIFTRLHSRPLLILFAVLATVVAPVTEELVFRAGIYRYLRTRLPRWPALLLPAVFFAALHVQWSTLEGLGSFVPLVALAVVFSLAYERTGRISVTIIAHSLFNLTTLLLLLAGVSP